jgi:hypothetical protein
MTNDFGTQKSNDNLTIEKPKPHQAIVLFRHYRWFSFQLEIEIHLMPFVLLSFDEISFSFQKKMLGIIIVEDLIVLF